jgi:hypothetical protein
MNKLTKIAGAIVLALSVNSSHAALTIVGTAANGYNFALSNGNVLTDGAVFKIGYYDSAYTGSYFSGLTTASAFETGWTTLAQSTANLYDAPGLRAASITLDTGVDTYVGKNLIMLVGNAATIAGSTQIGVFSNSAWNVPVNPTGVLPADYGFDIQESGTVAKFGSLSLGTGAYPDQGVVDSARLAVVGIPEPSSASLLALGMAGLVALRARRKS